MLFNKLFFTRTLFFSEPKPYFFDAKNAGAARPRTLGITDRAREPSGRSFFALNFVIEIKQTQLRKMQLFISQIVTPRPVFEARKGKGPGAR